MIRILLTIQICYGKNTHFLIRHQLTGADGPIPAKTEGVVAKKMLPLFVSAVVVGLDVTVTSPGSPVRLLPAKEVVLYNGKNYVP